MLAVLNWYRATVLFVLVHRSLPAMVLPRPPSSPNYIQRFDRRANYHKFDEGKSFHGYVRNSDGKRAVNDYSVVEIELQSPDEVDATSLQNLVHAMIKQSEQTQNDSYLNPDVIPHSIFGVRDVGLTPKFKTDEIDENRQVLISPKKFQNLDEKRYYLRNNGPKVYVNVRGHSGSFRKDTTSSNNPIDLPKVASSLHRQTDWKFQQFQHSKRVRPPKKFDTRVDVKREYQKLLPRSETKKLSRLAIVYGLDDLPTTENSMVTSSELPKQIPAPPSQIPSRTSMTQTTPVQRYPLRRTYILPGYSSIDI